MNAWNAVSAQRLSLECSGFCNASSHQATISTRIIDPEPRTALALRGGMTTTRWKKLLSQPFIKAVRDPTLIEGIYNTCDQWCMYCPATARCLAYRCQPSAVAERGDIYENLAARMFEGVKMLRDLNAAEGRQVPELDQLLADDPRESRPTLGPIDDPLEKMGRRYAVLSSRYLRSHPSFPFEMKQRPGGPTPLEVFAWYHVLIAAKIYRAITSSRQGARDGDLSLTEDALFSAKVALIGIDRSQSALAALQTVDDDARLQEMQAQLRRLARELDARFPGARRVVRAGLDRP
jgi:hypothetical protein